MRSALNNYHLPWNGPNIEEVEPFSIPQDLSMRRAAPEGEKG